MEENLNKPQPTPETPPPLVRQAKKIPKYLILILVIAGIAIAGYFLIPKLSYFEGELPGPIDETSNWKTYRNEEFGFEVKYPKDWVVSIDDYESINSPTHSRGTLFISIMNNDTNLELIDFLHSKDEEFRKEQEGSALGYPGFLNFNQIERFDLDGGHAYKFGLLNFSLSDVVVQNNHRVFIISNVSTPQGLSEKESQIIFDQILSTFKFIEPSSEIDNRILLTPQNIRQYNNPIADKSCEEEFNIDSATALADYTNQEKRISLKIPYNPKWGNDKYRLNPVDEYFNNGPNTVDYISFGYMGVFEGCGWARDYFIYFLSPSPVESVIKKIKEDIPPDYAKPEILDINSLTVIKYRDYGLCDYPTLRVIGDKYNYEVRKLCGGSFEELENIVRKIKLIK